MDKTILKNKFSTLRVVTLFTFHEFAIVLRITKRKANAQICPEARVPSDRHELALSVDNNNRKRRESNNKCNVSALRYFREAGLWGWRPSIECEMSVR